MDVKIQYTRKKEHSSKNKNNHIDGGYVKEEQNITERVANSQSWNNLSKEIKECWIITQGIKWISESLLMYVWLNMIETSTSALLTMSKPLTMWITTNWNILKEMPIPDHQTCLLKNLYAGQEAIVRTQHGTTDWFQIRKGICQGCIRLPCIFNLYSEYIMWNAGLDKAQAGIKIARRNINNLRYADDTTLMAESEEELKSLLKVKEESEKVGLKLNIQKAKIIASSPITSWQIDGETVFSFKSVSGWLYFFGLQNHCRWWLQPWN